MTSLACFAEPDHPVTVVRAVGLLAHGSAPVLHRAVRKALTDRPDLVLIDVAAVEVLDDVTLAVFPTLVRQAGAAEVAVMLVGPSPALAGHLESMGVDRQVPVHATRADAVAAHELRPGPARVQADLLCDPAAAREARDLVDRSCARWRIARLADHAALVTTELVANAVLHAGTPSRVTLTLRREHLHVSVRDGSHELPRRSADGRGLLIIEGLAAAWGCVPTADGKVVWTTLRLPPRRVAFAP